MINSTGRRIIVLGGGIFGTSTAAQLATRGARVTLITEAGLASGASGRSLGWLNSFGDQPAAYVTLRQEAIDRYRRFADDRPDTDFVRFCGGVWWGSDEAETDAEFDRLTERGYPIRRLSRDDAVGTLPGLSADGLPPSVLYEPEEGWVELAAMVRELAGRFTAAGGELITDAGPAEVEVAEGQVTAVNTGLRGRFDCDTVVVATGASVPSMVAAVSPVLDATSIALLVRTQPVQTDLQVVINSPRVALRPAPGGRLVVDHDWAAQSATETADGSFTAPPEIVRELLDEAAAVLADHPRLEVDALGIGRKPVPGDGLPVIGGIDGVDGYYVAFSHSGATLGLITGELLSKEILDGEVSSLLAPFRPRRFASGRSAV